MYSFAPATQARCFTILSAKIIKVVPVHKLIFLSAQAGTCRPCTRHAFFFSLGALGPKNVPTHPDERNPSHQSSMHILGPENRQTTKHSKVSLWCYRQLPRTSWPRCFIRARSRAMSRGSGSILLEPETYTLNSAVGRGGGHQGFRCTWSDIRADPCRTNFENVLVSGSVERKRALWMVLTSWKRRVTESRHKLMMDGVCVCHTVWA